MASRVVLWMFVALAGCLAPGCTLRFGEHDGSIPSIERSLGWSQMLESQREFVHGAVAADHRLASWAGAEMLRNGGNAVDAAVATSFALSVVRPESCGIGGGGFMLIHLIDDPRTAAPDDRVTVAIDYRERAPAMVGPDHFEDMADDASTLTGHAVAVPATVHGLLTALEVFGTMDRHQVLAPAIRIAREGFTPDEHHKECIATMLATLEARGDASESASWLRATYEGSERITNGAQARALEVIARDGRDSFRTGEIARAIIETVRAHGGVLTLDDMARYEPKVVEPLWGNFRGRRVAAMPLPSSGGIATLQILGLLERRLPEVEAFGSASPEYAHLLAECMKHAFSDRAEHLGDPEYDAIPVRELLDGAYMDARAASIDLERTFPPGHYVEVGAGAMAEDGGTSHLSVVDRWGNAAACTETINLEFGSKIAVAEFGFCLNNQMDDFQTKRGAVNAFGLVQSDRNLPAPGKRPLSSMSPTIVFDREGRVEVVAGASGGPRIISGTVQGLLNVLVWDRTAGTAMLEGRIHHQWLPDTLFFEFPPMGGEYSFERAVRFQSDPVAQEAWAAQAAAWVEGLEARGHALEHRDDIAHMQLIRRSAGRDGGEVWQAASDRRKGGIPDGH